MDKKNTRMQRAAVIAAYQQMKAGTAAFCEAYRELSVAEGCDSTSLGDDSYGGPLIGSILDSLHYLLSSDRLYIEDGGTESSDILAIARDNGLLDLDGNIITE